jgi:hypothetical protein
MNLMKMPLLLICLALIFAGIFWIDNQLAQAFAGISMGLACYLFWAMGRAQQTAEYWRGTGPRWMQSVHKQLHKMNDLIQARLLTYNACKMCAKVVGVIFILAILSIRNDLGNNWWVGILSFSTILVLGVSLTEWYIRRKFTRIDWKDIPPFP